MGKFETNFEIQRALQTLKSAWPNIPLVRGNMEANFSRLMAPLYGHHQYGPAAMQATLAGLMIGFKIDLPEEEGKLVTVGQDNLRMSLFLLWLALGEEEAVKSGSCITFEVTVKHYKQAKIFFEGHICVDAQNAARVDHGNLRRFFKRGAVVKVYLAMLH